MVCIYCGAETGVTNSRHQKRANQVWRRRQCRSCGAVFTTEERVNYDGVWLVRDKAGHSKPFSRQKLIMSLYRGLTHRKTALKDAEGLSETVINKLSRLVRDGSLDAAAIISVAQVALNRFDKVASVHYAAHHKG